MATRTSVTAPSTTLWLALVGVVLFGLVIAYATGAFGPNGYSDTAASILSGRANLDTVIGPTTLRAYQQGTWIVNTPAANQPGVKVTYSVRWGDEAVTKDQRAPQLSSTFTHTYRSEGVYHPAFVISSSSGTPISTVTVNVTVSQ